MTTNLSNVATKSAVSLRQRLIRDENGAVMILFGLSLFPILIATGVAVDYSRVSTARSGLQAALDAGVLAAANESNGRTRTELQATVKQFVESNKGNHQYRNLVTDADAGADWTVTATASACMDLRFGGFLGKTEQCFDLSSEAKRGKNHLEVALVLDNTGSMATSSDRIGNLRLAATSLANTLEKAVGNGRTVKISLVPFVTAVNVKGEGFSSAWMDSNAQNPLHGTNFDPPAGAPLGTKVNHFTLFNQMNVAWKGCVEARPTPYNLTDDAPSPGIGSTLFVPYFAPDDPGNATTPGNSGSNYSNSYLNDGVSGDNITKQRSVAKYATALPRPTPIVETANSMGFSENRTNGPNRACPTPILPLTDDFNKIRTNINAMRHWNGSGTNVSEGLMWGWRVLSPGEPYTGGRPFNDPAVQKVVVLLTDGENVVYGASQEAHKSDYGGYGYLYKGRFGALDQTTAARNVDGWVQNTCTQLKAQGVLLYTITLEAGTAANKSLYSPCASKAEYYFDSPNASQLNGIFTGIAQQLVALKLTR